MLIEMKNVQFLPESNENVRKSLDTGKYREHNPVHHPFDLKFEKTTHVIDKVEDKLLTKPLKVREDITSKYQTQSKYEP